MTAKRTKGRPPKVRDFEKEAQIARDYADGVPIGKITADAGYKSANSIYSILDLLGVPRRAGKPAKGEAQSA